MSLHIHQGVKKCRFESKYHASDLISTSATQVSDPPIMIQEEIADSDVKEKDETEKPKIFADSTSHWHDIQQTAADCTKKARIPARILEVEAASAVPKQEPCKPLPTRIREESLLEAELAVPEKYAMQQEPCKPQRRCSKESPAVPASPGRLFPASPRVMWASTPDMLPALSVQECYLPFDPSTGFALPPSIMLENGLMASEESPRLLAG